MADDDVIDPLPLTVITSIEQHVEWVADTIKDLDEKGIKTIEATEEAQANWVLHVNMVGGGTLARMGCLASL